MSIEDEQQPKRAASPLGILTGLVVAILFVLYTLFNGLTITENKDDLNDDTLAAPSVIGDWYLDEVEGAPWPKTSETKTVRMTVDKKYMGGKICNNWSAAYSEKYTQPASANAMSCGADFDATEMSVLSSFGGKHTLDGDTLTISKGGVTTVWKRALTR